jgi:multidrug efflux pump subunit AcrA (membrane-fusion protein)
MITRCGAVGLAVALVLSGCAPGNDANFQGWIEADLIFVSPDETGRVETLAVQEGDQVATGAPLFSVDADLQKADLQMQEAALKNAQQAYDRARDLLKPRPARKRPSRTRRRHCGPPRPGSTPRRRGSTAARSRAR